MHLHTRQSRSNCASQKKALRDPGRYKRNCRSPNASTLGVSKILRSRTVINALRYLTDIHSLITKLVSKFVELNIILTEPLLYANSAGTIWDVSISGGKITQKDCFPSSTFWNRLHEPTAREIAAEIEKAWRRSRGMILNSALSHGLWCGSGTSRWLPAENEIKILDVSQHIGRSRWFYFMEEL